MMPSTSQPVLDQLAQLRDIRLPVEVSWWPLAPGWWIALGVLAILFFSVVIFAAMRSRSLKNIALRELNQLQNQSVEAMPIGDLATEVGVLLRRLVLQSEPGKHLARAHSNAWQSFLIAAPDGMQESVAQIIAFAPYAPAGKIDDMSQNSQLSRDELLDAAKIWIRRHA